MSKSEYDKFDDAMDKLLKVSHKEIKEKLEAEKKDKPPRKRKDAKKPTE